MIEYGTKVTLTGSSKWARMGTWSVVKVNPAKYKLALVSDPSVILNAPKDMVREVTSDERTYAGPSRPEGLRLGSVVTMKRPPAGFDEFSLFVIIKDSIDVVNIVPLGGDDLHRYWKVAPAGLIVQAFGKM